MSETTSNRADMARHPDATTGLDLMSQRSTGPKISDRSPGRGLIQRIGTAIIQGAPTLMVLTILAGLAWWGHHHGWKLPKFSELNGTVKSDGVQWCDEHDVPEADCISCNADLMPKGELFGWCEVHGVHECVLEHPQLAQTNDPPEISSDDLEQAARAIAVRPRTPNDRGCKMHLRRIQFPSIEAVDRAGVDIKLVERGPVTETIKTVGEIRYDPTRVAKVSARASGTALRIEKSIGDKVYQGDVLALVDAVEVGRAKSYLLDSLVKYELAKKVFERLNGLGATVVPGATIQAADADQTAAEVNVRKAIQSLSNLGLAIPAADVFGKSVEKLDAKIRLLGIPESVRSTLDPSNASTNLIPVIAPRDGIIVDRDVVAGESVEIGKPFFTIADTREMWLVLRLRLEESMRVSMGQKIRFQPDGTRLNLTGKVSWISTDVDPNTRTVEIRGQLTNAEGVLKNETFGSGEIILREEDNAILVDNDAIHWEGCCHVAFVRDKDYFKEDAYKVFHTRSVRPGAIMGDKTEVIAGLLPDEIVVTKGSGILRAELLKGNLGAG